MEVDDLRHMFHVGFLLGALRTAGVTAEPLFDAQGDYTNEILIRATLIGDVRIAVMDPPDPVPVPF